MRREGAGALLRTAFRPLRRAAVVPGGIFGAPLAPGRSREFVKFPRLMTQNFAGFGWLLVVCFLAVSKLPPKLIKHP